jgi:hypothetical protein
MTGIRLGARCPTCQADAWVDPNAAAVRWTCGDCGVRCLWENGVMTAEPSLEALTGSADRLARERLGPPGSQGEEPSGAMNRAFCELLHRGRCMPA